MRTAGRATSGDTDTIRSITRDYAETQDPEMAKILLSAMSGDAGPAVKQVFCDEVLKTGDDTLVSFAIRQRIAPVHADDRTLFLFATGQLSGIPAHDREHWLWDLQTAYHSAPGYIQQAVCRSAIRWHTETLLADALLRTGAPVAAGKLSGAEWEIIVSGLISSSRYGELYRVLSEVTIPHALHAIRSLHIAGWAPEGSVRVLWDAVVRTLPERWSYPDPTVRERTMLELPASQTQNLVFSPDGAILATTAYNGKFRLWDVKRGELLPIAGECTMLSGIPIFSPDGRFLVTLHCNGELVVRSLPSGRLLWTIEGEVNRDDPVAVSPDCQMLAIASGRRVRILRLHDGSCSAGPVLEGIFPLVALAFSPKNQLLCGGCDNGAVALWSLKEHNPMWSGNIGSGKIKDLFFSPDAAGIIVIPKRGHAVRLDRNTGICTRVFSDKPGTTRSCSISPDGHYLAVASENNRVTLWRTTDGSRITSFPVSQKGGATCTAIVPGGQMVVTGGEKGILRFFRSGWPNPERMLTAHTDTISILAVSPDGKTLASAGWDGTTRLWSLPSGQVLRHLPVNALTLVSFCMSGDKKMLAAATGDGHVWLWYVPENRFIKTLDTFTGQLTAIALNSDGGLLACAGADATVRLWNTRDGSMIGVLSGISGSTRALAFTPDGKELLSGGWDEILRYWSVPDLHLRMTCPGHTSVITSITCSPDGTRFVSGGSDGSVRIWDASSGILLAVCIGDSRAVECVAVTPDGYLVAAGGRDTIIRLIRLADGSPVAEIAGSPATITSIAALPGNDLLAAGSDDGSVCFFSIVQRTHMRNFSAHAKSVVGTGYCDGGRVLASCGNDGTVRLWNLPESEIPADMAPEIMRSVAEEAVKNPSLQARRQWEFLHAFLTLRFTHEICLFLPPHSINEYDIGIAG